LLKFNQLIIKKFLIIISLLFITVGVVVYFWVKDFYLQQTQDTLKSNITLIALNLANTKNPDILAQEVKNRLGLRLTIVALDGSVIVDSHKDKKTLKNHKNREEIIQAKSHAYGYTIRHSITMDKDLLYLAQKCTTTSPPVYIRLAKEFQNINEHIFALGEEILAITALFFAFIFFLIFRMSKTVEQEVQKIANFLTAMTKKKKETYVRSELSLEFYNITSLLTKVAQILVKREKQKNKFTNRLQASNKQKDDIISAISHEFKNPIAVINGYSQTILDDPDINPNIRQKFITKIYKNGVKLSELIDTLRLSSKLDSGQQEIRFKTIELSSLLYDTAENLKLNYPKRHVIIEGDTTVTLKGDEALLGIVLTNLIENAFKYSEDEVHVAFDENSINVTDTGIGISAKHIEKITNKFYRVNRNTWNSSLGLGLFIVSNILKMHHFTLSIQSKENKGSTFSIEF